MEARPLAPAVPGEPPLPLPAAPVPELEEVPAVVTEPAPAAVFARPAVAFMPPEPLDSPALAPAPAVSSCTPESLAAEVPPLHAVTSAKGPMTATTRLARAKARMALNLARTEGEDECAF